MSFLHTAAIFCLALSLFSFAPCSAAQADAAVYARKYSFGIVAAYSNDSSHMLLGGSENRKLLDFGASFDRRLFTNHWLNWQYDAEYLPLAWDSDPVQVTTTTITITQPPSTQIQVTSMPTIFACRQGSGSGSFPGTGISYTFVSTCTRRWVIGQAMSPVGMRWNFEPRHRLQPFVVGHGGYMYSSQPIPVPDSGSFNFTFDMGAGVEFFRTRTQSFRAEYRFHHISNHDTANFNPGIDSNVFQFSWTLGR